MIAEFKIKSRLAALVAAALTITLPGSAIGHHSFAMFDNKKNVEMSGVVREFQWTNPHAWIQLTVQKSGAAVEYSIELGSPNNLSRNGWTRRALRPGDRVKAIVHPRKDGSNGGSLVNVTKADGTVLSFQ